MLEINELDFLAFSANPNRPKANLIVGESTVWISVIGNSGIGKTTFLKILSGIYHDGERISWKNIELNPKRRIQYFSYMSQQDSLFSNLSVFENLKLALIEPKIDLDRFASENAHYLNLFQIPIGHLSRFPRELSVGQKAKVQLLRTILLDRPVLLLDEPFAALHQKARLRILLQLKEIFRSQGRLVMAVTHDPLLAEVISDQVLLLTQSSANYCEANEFASLALQVPEFAEYWPESAVIHLAGERLVLTPKNAVFSSYEADAENAFEGRGIVFKVVKDPIAKAQCSRGVVTVLEHDALRIHSNNSVKIAQFGRSLENQTGVFCLITQKNYESATFLTVLNS